MKNTITRWLNFFWYTDRFVAVLLAPFSLIYEDVIKFRRFLYRIGLLRSHKLPVPVIVIGNITVGGTGKTPLLIRLTQLLREQGYRPGIISRGYGGKAEHWPQWVIGESDPRLVGDEAVLIAKHLSCPVAVDPSRVAAAKLLLGKCSCNVILSDDGLQHYALQRDIEIVVIDGKRRFGNASCLPAGPLREPISRLQKVDFVLCNGGIAEDAEYEMQLTGAIAVKIRGGEKRELSRFTDQKCHALAGIGNPARFFDLLEQAGVSCIKHPFPDHHDFQSGDIDFADEHAVLMTEKDAVKCQELASDKHWFVPVEAQVQTDFIDKLLLELRQKSKSKG